MSQQVRCFHILQKHTGSRNPNDSYRKKPITRSLDEARQNIQNFKDQIKSMEDFTRIAGEFSECGSAANGGDLGHFGPGQMQKPFEEAAFSLQVGGMAVGVETDSGVHIILRVE